MPPAVYAVLVWRRFGGIDLSGYVPHEALGQALAGGDAAAILAAPLVSLNMTSGALLANMYELTVGQAVLTAALGAAIALNAAALMRARRVCAARAGGGAAAAGTGLLAATAAASTGIMGCCGSGAVGGALALAGLGAASAGAVAAWSPAVQALLAAGLAANWLRLRRAAAAG